jgi:hypothetical protein
MKTRLLGSTLVGLVVSACPMMAQLPSDGFQPPREISRKVKKLELTENRSDLEIAKQRG